MSAPSLTAERVAQEFHEAYERLAPEFGYRTRRESAVPWETVPTQNKLLMEHVVLDLLSRGVIAKGRAPTRGAPMDPSKWDEMGCCPSGEPSAPDVPVNAAHDERETEILIDWGALFAEFEMACLGWKLPDQEGDGDGES